MYTKPMKLGEVLKDHVPIQYEDALVHPNLYGIEVELEGVGVGNTTPQITAYWTKHNDHSLRIRNPGDQTAEYVFKKPLLMADSQKAIDALFDHLDGPGVVVHESYRTSIHVHMNFALDTFLTIYNFMTLSIILDELLVSQNGDHRIGNNFCLRAKDALGQVEEIIKSIEQGYDFFNLVAHNRYSSINFVSLLKFGTIEFRSLECTTHRGRLLHWVSTLARIKQAAKMFKDPTDIIGTFSRSQPQEFLFKVLGPQAVKYSQVPGVEDMLRNGMRIAQDLAYCSQWKPWTKENAKELEGPKLKLKVNKIPVWAEDEEPPEFDEEP